MLVVLVGVLVLGASAIADGVSSVAIGKCPRNAVYKQCPGPCQPTCDNPNGIEPCTRSCREYGCECKPGYVLSPKGSCIRLDKCPGKCPRNAIYKQCPWPCQPTCDNPSGIKPCMRSCREYGCECKPGYVLSPKGLCIRLNKCPAAKYCLKNETFAACKVDCPSEFCPSDDSRARVACAVAYPCPPGCVCKENHRRISRADNRCILASDCPPVKCKRPNEEWNSCPPNCLAERCDDIGKVQEDCNFPLYCEPQCVCKKGYYRNESDICIPAIHCKNCPPNAIYKKCPSPCPGTCQYPSGTRPCSNACLEYGCECKPGYVLSDGICILLKECPAAKSCTKNETFTSCKINCPNNYCPEKDTRAKLICDPPRPCPSGCICQANHRKLSRTDDRCILASDCPPLKCKRPNEEWSRCPPNCLAERCEDIAKNQTECNFSYSYCDPKCICKPGFYRNASDICIPAIECKICPPNAILQKYPSPCPGTCDYPSGTISCPNAYLEYGCECKSGYVLSDEKCILLKECPAAKSCKKNETFAACRAECPNNYCPENDIRGIIACDPPYPCQSGCICQANHRRFSSFDDRCILASDCPPLKCKRPNEEWSRCPSNCLAERCEDIGKKQTECKLPYSYCDPKCVCKPGFYRNSSDICILASSCPKKCSIKPECRSTCAVPNPPNCRYTKPPATNIDGCQCQEGFVLSKTNGACIEIEECPGNLGCNGDTNAVVKQYPVPCPSTCDSPNALPCKRKSDPIGCECAPGYLLSIIGGKCIRPDQCKGGDPCGPNGMFTQCKSGCPYDYCPVDDSRAVIICEYFPFSPCYSGCICKINHKRKSRKDNRCIVSSDCPPVNCTRPYEVWNPCPSDCSSEYCDAVDIPEHPCNTLLLNCQPRCVCEKNYFRNASDICVSADECRKINSQNNVTTPPPEQQCGVNEVLSDCKIVCPPQTCDSIFARYMCPENATCELGCNCIDGYLRNRSGICVPSDECFTLTTPSPEQQCGVNEVLSDCKIACPPQTCESIFTTYMCPKNPSCELGCNCLDGYLRNESGICVPSDECFTPQWCPIPRECRPTCAVPNPQDCSVESSTTNENGCRCKSGYVLTHSEGECIEIENCPNNLGCNGDRHAVIKRCPWSCPSTCNAPNTIQCRKACLPVGCQCVSGYILSKLNGKCIRPDHCPYGNPCGVNGTFSDCGFRCPNQYCPKDDSLVQYACKPGRPCPPGCLCKDSYKRISNKDDSCVLASDCPPVNCTRPNEVWNPCPKCLTEKCKDINNPDVCPEPSGTNHCQPRCGCTKGHCRDENDACIPVTECME